MKFFSILLFWTLTSTAAAQTVNNTTYPLSGYTGIVLEDLSLVPEIIGPGVSFASYSPVIPFGSDFKFCYNGVCHDSFRVQVSGKLGFGESTLFSMYGISDVIAPLSNRMTTGTNGWVKYSLMGTAPNRKLVVEWKVRMQTNSVTVSAIHQFQLWLHENGRIDFVYGNMPASWNGTGYQNYSVWLAYNQITTGTTTVAVGTPIQTSVADYTGVTGSQTTTIEPQSMLSFIPSPVPVALPPVDFETILPSCLTMRIVDTTTNEFGYKVYRSDNGLHYDHLLADIRSVTSNNTDTFYVNDSLLLPNTTYHYAVVPYNLGLVPDTFYTTITTPPPMLAGVYTIPGDYATIQEAFEDISCKQLASDVYLELDDAYDFSQEVLPIEVDDRMLTSPSQTLTVRPKPGSAGIVMNNFSDTSVFVLRKAAYFRLDGRSGGTSSESFLTINQFNGAHPAIAFKDTSVHNRIVYCNIKGKGSTNYSQDECLVYFHASNVSQNTLEQCSFGNLPDEWLKYVIIVEEGSVQQHSDSNQVMNCHFSNFGIQSGKTVSANTVAAIKINDHNSGWNIEGNSFFMTDVLQTTFSSCIIINAPGGENYSIRNNWFGGTAPQCEGNKMEVVTSVYPRGFQYIKLHGGPLSSHQVTGNRFDNIHIQIPESGSNGNFDFIHLRALRLAVDSNIAGNVNDPESIHYDFLNDNSPTFKLNFIAVHGSVAQPHHFTVHNNRLHNLKTSGRIDVTGINIVSGINNNVPDYMEISDNVIGGVSENSIQSDTRFIGIEGRFGLNDLLLMNNNTIRNFWGKIDAVGIKANDAQYTVINQDTAHVAITGNTITNGFSDLSVAGCFLSSDRGRATIQKNDIYGLKSFAGNEYTTGVVNGIATTFYENAAPCVVDGNTIHHLDALRARATVEGIHLHGRGITQNNMIALGRDKQGNFINDSIKVSGLIIGSFHDMDTVIVRHNSIYLTGDSIDYESGFFINSAPSRAVYCVMRPNTHFTNNLIVTKRSNALADFGTAGNWALGGYCDYNQYFSNRPDYFGEETIINHLTFNEWTTDYGQDLNSFFMPPYFINPDGDSATWDLHLQPHNYAESNGLITDIQLDIDADDRTILSPADIGADAGDFYSIPMIDLGADSLFLCAGDSIYLSPGSGYAQYDWSTGSSSDGIYITTPGTYSLVITDAYGYTSADSVLVMSSSMPVFNLPADSTLCMDDTIELLIPGGYASYDWSNGDTTHSTRITEPGIYHVSVSNNHGCIHRDTITIATDSLYNYSFTQIHSICNNDSINLVLLPDEFVYTWHDTTLITNSITLYPATVNYFTVSSPSGCSVTDSITVTAIHVDEPLPEQVDICTGDSVLIYGDYVSSSGTYTAVFSSVLGCDSTVSTILTVHEPIVIQLPVIELCEGDSVLFFDDYLSSSGVYTQQFQAIAGCDSIISQELIVHPLPDVLLDDFHPDLLCIDAGITALPVGTPSGGVHSGTGVSASGFDPSEAGTGSHFVYYFYKDEHGCVASDSSMVVVDNCLSLEIHDQLAEIQVAPNPSTGVFFVSRNGNASEPLQLDLYDVRGKHISTYFLPSGASSVITIDIQQHENGVYFLRTKSAVTKLIKSR